MIEILDLADKPWENLTIQGNLLTWSNLHGVRSRYPGKNEALCLYFKFLGKRCFFLVSKKP